MRSTGIKVLLMAMGLVLIAGSTAWAGFTLLAPGAPCDHDAAKTCFEARITDTDITYDVSTYTDFFVSRDNGLTWEKLFENTSKQLNWTGANGASVLGSVRVPVGHYTLSKSKATVEVLHVSINDGTNPAGSLTVTMDDQDSSWNYEACDFTVERNGNVALVFDDPIVSVDVLYYYEAGQYVLVEYDNDISKKEQTGSLFK